eukprot:COSAG06_NODE_28040_length_581_cov_19.788382_1_plen_130_part_10
MDAKSHSRSVPKSGPSSLAVDLRRRKRRSALRFRQAVVVLVCSSKEQPLVFECPNEWVSFLSFLKHPLHLRYDRFYRRRREAVACVAASAGRQPSRRKRTGRREDTEQAVKASEPGQEKDTGPPSAWCSS